MADEDHPVDAEFGDAPFLACATTSMGMKAHIRGYRRSADHIAEEARMGRTKRGSFIIPILMPLAMPDPPTEKTEEDTGKLFDEQVAAIEPETRRVMRTQSRLPP